MLAAVAETLVLYYLGHGLGVSANEIPHSGHSCGALIWKFTCFIIVPVSPNCYKHFCSGTAPQHWGCPCQGAAPSTALSPQPCPEFRAVPLARAVIPGVTGLTRVEPSAVLGNFCFRTKPLCYL